MTEKSTVLVRNKRSLVGSVRVDLALASSLFTSEGIVLVRRPIAPLSQLWRPAKQDPECKPFASMRHVYATRTKGNEKGQSGLHRIGLQKSLMLADQHLRSAEGLNPKSTGTELRMCHVPVCSFLHAIHKAEFRRISECPDL